MKLFTSKNNQQGFTLIELLVVIGILAILLAITLIALNPTQHFQGARNSQRQSDVTAILDSIYEYEAAHTGNLPPSVSAVTTTATPIGTGTNEINPCTDVVPAYLADMPLDPDSTVSSKAGATACAGNYESGYAIAKSASGRFTITAPHAENANISVTR